MAAQATTSRGQATVACTSKPTASSYADPFINITREHGVVFPVEEITPIATYVDAFTDTMGDFRRPLSIEGGRLIR